MRRSGEPLAGISLKPTSPTIAGFSFDFSDWNDIAGGVSQRSEFLVLASDVTSTTVTGPGSPPNTPPKNFAVALSPADIAAGVYLTEIRWIGTDGGQEVVGFYNVKTYTNPLLVQRAATPVPSLSPLALFLLSVSLAGACFLRPKPHAG